MTVTVVTGDDCVTVVTGDDCVTVVTGDDGEVSAGSGRDEEEHDGEATEAERRYLQLTSYLIPSYLIHRQCNKMSSM